MIDSQDNGWGAGEVPISLAYVKDPPSKCSPKILLIDRISDRIPTVCVAVVPRMRTNDLRIGEGVCEQSSNDLKCNLK